MRPLKRESGGRGGAIDSLTMSQVAVTPVNMMSLNNAQEEVQSRGRLMKKHERKKKPTSRASNNVNPTKHKSGQPQCTSKFLSFSLLFLLSSTPSLLLQTTCQAFQFQTNTQAPKYHSHQALSLAQTAPISSSSSSSSSSSQQSGTETHLVRGLANAQRPTRIELPCLVDQANCGEVYYITWTRQLNATSGLGPVSPAGPASQLTPKPSQLTNQWARVYLYTGAGDSAPHKPIGDLVNRATFLMPAQDQDQTGTAGAGASKRPMARLVIEEPRLSDEALYKCDVTYVKGKCPSISLVRVQMMALPERAQISQMPSGSKSKQQTSLIKLEPNQVVGPLNEHDQLRLMCQVAGGRPAPRAVFWRRIDSSGRLTNLSPAQQQATSLANVLEVPLNHTLTSADLGAKFECHVEHEALESLRPAARIISATHLQRPRPSPLPPDAMLDLHPAASSPSDSINRHDQERAGELFSSADDSAGDLGDEASSPNGQGQLQGAVSGSASLDSHVIIDLNVGVSSLDLFLTKLGAGQPSAATSTSGRRNASEPLLEGDLVELECVAYNSKPAANITWLSGSDSLTSSSATDNTPEDNKATGISSRADAAPNETILRGQRNRRLLQRQQVQLNPDGRTYNTHSFLSIKLSRHEHRAQFSCQAQNGPMRQPMVKSLELQVQHVPLVLMEPAGGLTVNEFVEHNDGQSQSMDAIPGQQNGLISPASKQPAAASSALVQIYCIYSANPFQLVAGSTRWFKDGQPLAANGERLLESLTPTGYPTLAIKQVSRHDAGRYDCQLSNVVGTSERLPASEATKLEVNFRPSVQLRLYKSSSGSSELVEVDLDQELAMPGDEFVLACQVLEAQPAEIVKFHWFSHPLVQSAQKNQNQAPKMRPIGTSEGQRFKLGALPAGFTPSVYACAAQNALGPSELSNSIELQLSHTPGPSRVRPVSDPLLRKMILSSGSEHKLGQESSFSLLTPNEQDQEHEFAYLQESPLPAGRELLLECATRDLGRPRANIWLWFKDGQTLESPLPSTAATTIKRSTTLQQGDAVESFKLAQDVEEVERIGGGGGGGGVAGASNPISDRLRDLSSSSGAPASRAAAPTSLLASGRFLSIPAVQLAHRGNYSCVAVNRLGSGSVPAASNQNGRDSYRLAVALAPSFIQPLAARTYWAESQDDESGGADPQAGDASTDQAELVPQQLELVCRVQCEPLCQLEWLRNGERLNEQLEENEFVQYRVRLTNMDEMPGSNLFKSVESRLVLKFRPLHPHHQQQQQQQQRTKTDNPNKRLVIDRDRLLARRHFLNSSNFTCQSGPNAMGPAVRSTSKLVVQYPPENVLISAPSDKLNLVEGSNGPLLGCEAQGEPQVQYRWLLLRTGGQVGTLATGGMGSANNKPITSSDLVASRYNMKLIIGNGGSSSGRNSSSATMRKRNSQQSNDSKEDSLAAAAAADRLLELAGPSAGELQVGGVQVSTLDLSAMGVDRRQSGHYICEASNALGQTRQSVYVNVLYKPTCTTLHLHSLDLTAGTTSPEALASSSGRQQEGTVPSSSSSSGSTNNDQELELKPLGATNRHEYSLLIRETSDDFVGLRRLLVMSPLVASDELKFSLDESVFGNKPANDRDASLLHHDDDLASSQNSLQLNDQQASAKPQDSWSKFNAMLLKFLNDYSRQIKQDEDGRALRVAQAQAGKTPQSSSQQTRRSFASTSRAVDLDEAGSRDFESDQATPSGDKTAKPRATNRYIKNLLTFACMALEGSPLNNLTFDWYFGGVKLPANHAASHNVREQQHQQEAVLIYANENATLEVMMARRLDTKTLLSPFQMSLLTVNVVLVSPSFKSAQDGEQPPLSLMEQPIDAQQDSPSSGNVTMLMRAPVIKSRYQSFYGSLKEAGAPGDTSASSRNANRNGNGLQFGHELDSMRRPQAEQQREQSARFQVDLSEHNWQERLGELLSCSVSNPIGTSNLCPVQVNLAERAKSGGLNGDHLGPSSTLYEFAKWRMPSLAHKSLLIISVLIGCSLIVFATFALLIGPHLRAMQMLQKVARPCGSSNSSGASSSQRDETGTGQSSQCSQKSSVLGLLGNGCSNDSSLPSGSSDDDTSARLHQLDICNGGRKLGASSRQLVGGANSSLRDDSYSYDRPRNSILNTTAASQQRLIYQPDGSSGAGFNLAGQEGATANCAYENYHYHESSLSASAAQKAAASGPGKILASLRSKFKVQDRIFDLANDQRHTRNVSNAETTTTGVSDDLAIVNSSSRSLGHTNFGMPSNLRHSYAPGTTTNSNTYRHLTAQQQRQLAYNAQPPAVPMTKPHFSQFAPAGHYNESNLDEAANGRLLQLNSQVLINPATLTIDDHQHQHQHQHQQHQQQMPNAMDEFMRRRGLNTDDPPTFNDNFLDNEDTLATTYGSQSIRNQSSTLCSLRSHDLMQKQTVARLQKPPVYPRTSYGLQAYHSSTMFKPNVQPPPPPPPVAARQHRPSQMSTHQMYLMNQQQQQQQQTASPYSESYIHMQRQQTMPQIVRTIDTIDSHLVRPQPDNVAPYYSNQHQLAYANTIDVSQHNPYAQGLLLQHDNHLSHNQSAEHIYDLNAYATPEQTPLRTQPNNVNNNAKNQGQSMSSSSSSSNNNNTESERLRVSQLIQSFNTKLPDQ